MADAKQLALQAKPAEPQKEYVAIPEYDMFDNKITVFHNHEQYEGGKTYLVDSGVAVEIRRLLKVREQADLRILRPRQDSKYRAQLEGNAKGKFLNESEV
jgi:hypothetical protein